VVGITAGSREVPGRNACDRRHTYCIIIIIIIIINTTRLSPMFKFARAYMYVSKSTEELKDRIWKLP